MVGPRWSSQTRFRGAARTFARTAALGLVLALGPGGCGTTEDQPLTEARALLDAGETEEGLAVLREAARAHPEDLEISFTLGTVLLQLGRPSEAMFPLSKAAASDEFGVQAGIVLANALAETGNFEQAIDAADAALAQDPEAVAALLVRVNAALQINEFEKALESVDRLLLHEPDSAAFLQLRGTVLAEAGRHEEAEEIFKGLLGRSEEAPPSITQRACMGLARLYGKGEDGETERAIAQLVQCEEMLGGEPIATLTLIGEYDRLERAEEGTKALERLVVQFPEQVELRQKLAERLIASDRFADAESVIGDGDEEDWGPERWAAISHVRSAAGDHLRALEAINRAVELSAPAADPHLFVKADLEIATGSIEAAEETLARIEEPLYAQSIRARLAQAKGDPKQALELYDDVLPRWPQNYVLRVLAAQAALELGDRDRAETELLEATRQAPSETDAAMWLARLHFAQGEYEDAANMANRQIEQRGTTAPDAYILAARAFARTGQRKGAQRYLDRLVEARDGMFAGVAVAEMGRIAAQRGKPAAALEAYEAVLDTHQVDLAAAEGEAALTQLLQMQGAAGRIDEAAKRVEALVSDHPDRAFLHAMRGRVAILQNDADLARDALDRALEIDPELPAALAGRALLLKASGDLEAAGDAMERAWEIGGDPDHGYMAARLRFDAGETQSAIASLDELVLHNPDHAAAANDLAWALAERQERLPYAVQLARTALRLMPRAETLDTLGYVQLQSGDLNSAISSFRRSLDTDPDYATGRYHLAMALHRSGRNDEARESLEAVLGTTFPESEEARALLARIGKNEEHL